MIANELRRLAEAHRGDGDLSLARRTALGLLDMARRSVTHGQRGLGSRPELVLVADVSWHGGIVRPSPRGRHPGQPAGVREAVL